MFLANKLRGARSPEKTYSDDVFSVDCYGGNSGTRNIFNSVDLSTHGGMVLFKARDLVVESFILDSQRENGNWSLSPSDLNPQYNQGAIWTRNTNGITLTSSGGAVNLSTYKYVAYTFRKAAKFFDVITYSGNGVGNRPISHSLGLVPGMIITKSTNQVSHWRCYHVGTGTTSSCYLNSSAAANGEGTFPTTPTASEFFVNGAVNSSGQTYVAYAFADDPSEDGVVRCGSFTTDGSGNATVDIGWEPQFLLAKASSTSGDWILLDNMRGWDSLGVDCVVSTNGTATESTSDRGEPTSFGFNFKSGTSSAETYLYMAIRRPNKPITSTSKHFFNLAYSSVPSNTDKAYVSDLIIGASGATTPTWIWCDRVRGFTSSGTAYPSLNSSNNLASSIPTGARFYRNISASDSHASIGFSYPNAQFMFGRATGFFDIVRHIGLGAASVPSPVKHNLNVIPELIISKRDSATEDWLVRSPVHLGVTHALALNTSAASYFYSGTSVSPTNKLFYLQYGIDTAGSSSINFLFASSPNVSKVGKYTGNGSSQNIDCAFSGGARFVMIKRIDSAGDWYVWDTARGIVAGNDPYVALNSNASEVTTNDSIDPLAAGFIVNQVAATNINVTSATYLFLAIA